jgi:hypothetical protein
MLRRGGSILLCLFLLLSGFLHASPSIDESPASPLGDYAGSLEAASNVDTPKDSHAGKDQCRDAPGCSPLFLPPSQLAFVARTQTRTIGVEAPHRGIGRAPGFPPPRLSIFV